MIGYWSKELRSELVNKVKDLLVYSQAYPFEIHGCEAIIDQWFKAKQSVAPFFGESLRIRSEEPVSMLLTQEQKADKFRHFLAFLNETDVLDDDFRAFLEANEEGFFNNRVVKSFREIKKGAKLLGSFKYFIESQSVRRWIQDVASTYIQENKIHGYLYASIHPIDFLTLSDNAANWSSCCCLTGDYRASGLSYMLDPSTFIVYLADDKDVHIPNLPFKWNNKKWRILVHTDLKNCVYYNRQYPYTSLKLLIKEVIPMLENTLFYNQFAELPKKYTYTTVTINGQEHELTDSYIVIGGRSFPFEEIVDLNSFNGFCDFRDAKYLFAPDISFNRQALCDYFKKTLKDMPIIDELEEVRKLAGIKIGERVICARCGKHHVSRHITFLCDHCIEELGTEEDFFLRCSLCDKKIPQGDKPHKEDGEYYCLKCYQILKQKRGED